MRESKVLTFPCFGFITYKNPGPTGDTKEQIHDVDCLIAFLSWARMDNAFASSVVFAPDAKSAAKTFYTDVDVDKEWPELTIKDGGKRA